MDDHPYVTQGVKMPKYYRLIKGPLNIGRETVPTGMLVELNEVYDSGTTPNGLARKYHSYPRHIHPDVDLFDHQVESIDFEPSPLYNHAVVLGFNAEPAFLQAGCAAFLERIYWMMGQFNPLTSIDTWMEWYIRADDEAKYLEDSPHKAATLRFAETYRKRCDLLERLQMVVQKYNAAGVIQNYKD